MNRYTDEAVKSICESVRFDSSQSAPLPGMPFGKGAADCLEHFLSLAQALGFETNNYDNYVGEVVFGAGKTPRQINEIVSALRSKGQDVLVTRISDKAAAADKADFFR